MNETMAAEMETASIGARLTQLWPDVNWTVTYNINALAYEVRARLGNREVACLVEDRALMLWDAIPRIARLVRQQLEKE